MKVLLWLRVTLPVSPSHLKCVSPSSKSLVHKTEGLRFKHTSPDAEKSQAEELVANALESLG